MTPDHIHIFAAMRPPIHLPASITLAPGVEVVDVATYISTNLLHLDSPSPSLRALAQEALDRVVVVVSKI